MALDPGLQQSQQVQMESGYEIVVEVLGHAEEILKCEGCTRLFN